MRKSNRADIGASDEALLAGMAIGDEGAGVAFVRRYQRRVYGLAVGLVGDHALAEDIAQEALLRAWRHAPVFDPRRASVATWVLTITRNLAVDALRLRRAVPTDPEKLIEMGTFSRGGVSRGAGGSVRSRRAGPLGASVTARRATSRRGLGLVVRLHGGRGQRDGIDPPRDGQDPHPRRLGKLRDAATSRGLSDVSSDQ